jgi:hypothetical protein
MNRIFRLVDKAWEKARFWRKKKQEKAVGDLNSLGYTVILERGGKRQSFPCPQDKKYQAVQRLNPFLE